MKKLLSISAALSILLSPQAHAFGTSPAIVYSNLFWNVSSNAAPVSTCNTMVLDGTGNLATTSRLVAYGTLNCPGIGSLAATGTAYIGVNGLFNIILTIAGGSQLICSNLSSTTLSGSCFVFNSVNTLIGTAVIGYVP